MNKIRRVVTEQVRSLPTVGTELVRQNINKAVVAMITIMLATSAQAQNISIKYDNGIKHIHFSGDIHEDSDKKLEKVIKVHPDIEWITFDSYGGDFAAGNRINLMLDEYIMSAAVKKNHRCVSACANAFIGAERLSVEGKLKFHSHHREDYEGNGRIRIDKLDIRDAIYESQLNTSLTIYYMLRSGFSWELHYDYALKAGDFITFRNNDQLKKYYIGKTHFSNEYDNGVVKKFVKFSKIASKKADRAKSKKHDVIKLSSKCLRSDTVYEGRVRFRDEGIKTFYQSAPGSGRTKRLKVNRSDSWSTGSFKNGYVFLHTAKAKVSTYGWIKINQLEKICK